MEPNGMGPGSESAQEGGGAAGGAVGDGRPGDTLPAGRRQGHPINAELCALIDGETEPREWRAILKQRTGELRRELAELAGAVDRDTRDLSAIKHVMGTEYRPKLRKLEQLEKAVDELLTRELQGESLSEQSLHSVARGRLDTLEASVADLVTACGHMAEAIDELRLRVKVLEELEGKEAGVDELRAELVGGLKEEQAERWARLRELKTELSRVRESVEAQAEAFSRLVWLLPEDGKPLPGWLDSLVGRLQRLEDLQGQGAGVDELRADLAELADLRRSRDNTIWKECLRQGEELQELRTIAEQTRRNQPLHFHALLGAIIRLRDDLSSAGVKLPQSDLSVTAFPLSSDPEGHKEEGPPA